MFGTSVEESMKMISKWAAAYYKHLNSYYQQPTTHAISLPRIKIAKPTLREMTRNEKGEVKTWGKMHGKSIRQRNRRQDYTMDDRTYTKLSGKVLKPVNLNSLKSVERVPRESNGLLNSN